MRFKTHYATSFEVAKTPEDGGPLYYLQALNEDGDVSEWMISPASLEALFDKIGDTLIGDDDIFGEVEHGLY